MVFQNEIKKLNDTSKTLLNLYYKKGFEYANKIDDKLSKNVLYSYYIQTTYYFIKANQLEDRNKHKELLQSKCEKFMTKLASTFSYSGNYVYISKDNDNEERKKNKKDVTIELLEKGRHCFTLGIFCQEEAAYHTNHDLLRYMLLYIAINFYRLSAFHFLDSRKEFLSFS